jgi:hypothetical protein
MTQEDWDALKAQMETPYGVMKLQCDQFELTLVQEVSSKSRSWSTAVYVDGFIKGEWISAQDGQPKCEEARRFLRKVSRALYSKKDIDTRRRILGKREATKLAEVKYVCFLPNWKSFSSLKKHLIANNDSIRVLH